jgi:hypothetical protein
VKNPHAVALGRIGGRKGGPARMAGMTPEERRAFARAGAAARWGRHDGSALMDRLSPERRMDLAVRKAAEAVDLARAAGRNPFLERLRARMEARA